MQALSAGQPPECTVKDEGGANDGCIANGITNGCGWNGSENSVEKESGKCSKRVDNDFWGEPDVAFDSSILCDDSDLSCEELGDANEQNEEPMDNICDAQRVDVSVSISGLQGKVKSLFTDVRSDLCVANVKCGEFSEGLKVANLVSPVGRYIGCCKTCFDTLVVILICAKLVECFTQQM